MKNTNYPIILMMLAATFILLSQTLSFNPKTGDEGFDNKLNEINVEALSDINNFIDRVNSVYLIEKNQVQELLNVFEPAELLIALQICHVTDNTLLNVIENYKRNKSKGWKSILSDLGIKSTSYEFVELKKIVNFNDVSYITNTISQNKH